MINANRRSKSVNNLLCFTDLLHPDISNSPAALPIVKLALQHSYVKDA